MEPANQPTASRSPDQSDLVRLCRELNAQEVRYLVVGGFAIIQQGLARTTEDIDLLLEPSLENQRRVKRALLYLPDQAVRELGDEDLTQYVVARVADEILVDLMFAACGVTYAEAKDDIEVREIAGVAIPFASARLLWRMKQTVRDKDVADRAWLRARLGMPDQTSDPSGNITVPRWLWYSVLALAVMLASAWVAWWFLQTRSRPG